MTLETMAAQDVVSAGRCRIYACQLPDRQSTEVADTRDELVRWWYRLAEGMGIFAGGSGKILPMSWEQLGDAVRHRRKELGLTQADVTARGGPSVETVRAVENKRAGRMGPLSRRALERAIEWEEGSIDALLNGDAPRVLGADIDAPAAAPAPSVQPPGGDATSAAAERFAMAERLIKMRQAFADHREGMAESARIAMEEQFTAAAREIEEAVIWMLPRLGDVERAAAIRILAELRDG
jgi:transcriptional regulator with XRE-family HTH domain